MSLKSSRSWILVGLESIIGACGKIHLFSVHEVVFQKMKLYFFLPFEVFKR